MATEQTPMFFEDVDADADVEAATPSYGATEKKLTPAERRVRGVFEKRQMLARQKTFRAGDKKETQRIEKIKSLREGLDEPQEEEDESKIGRTWLRSMMRRHSHYWYTSAYRGTVTVMICATVVNFLLDSEIYFKTCCTPFFSIAEKVIATFFLVEFILKIITAPQRRAFKGQDHSASRIKYMFTFEGLVDVMSFLPTFVMMFLGISPTVHEPLKIFSLIRMLKSDFLLESFRMVNTVLFYNSQILISSFLVCFLMMVLCAIWLWYARPAYDPEHQFSSILSCFYLAILMLTGQGIPDSDGMMPWYTRIPIAVTALFAIAQFAIPASMLTWGFEQIAERNIVKTSEREKKLAEKVRAGRSCPMSSSSSGESDRQEEWDGYLEQVAGSGSGSGSDKEDQGEAPYVSKAQELLLSGSIDHELSPHELKRAKRVFAKLDYDKDGLMNMEKIRLISDNDEDAKDLLHEISKFADGDHVSLREFILWLSFTKTRFTRHGDQIFLRLMNRIETILKTANVASARWKTAASALKLGVLKRAGQTTQPPAVKKADEATSHKQLVILADRFGELERHNKRLLEKIDTLESTLASLKKQ